MCFLAVSTGVLKVRLDTKAPKKFSYIYIYCNTIEVDFWVNYGLIQSDTKYLV